MVEKKKRNYLIYIILLFIYIFSIPIIHYNTQLLIEITAFGIIFLRTCCFGKISIPRKAVSIIEGYVPFVLYITIMFFIHSTKDPQNANAYYETYILFVKFFIRTIIICSYFELYRVQNKINKQEFLNALITVGCLQLICVILAFISPAIRTAFLTLIKNNTTSIDINRNMQYLGRRSYGLSENLFDSFGYVCALLIVVTFWKGMKENKISYIVLSIIMLIMPALNSRTGLALATMGVAFVFIAFKHNIRNLKFSLKILAVGIPILLITLFCGAHLLPESTLEWVQDGINEIVNLLIYGQQTGTFEIISEEIALPVNVMWGAGASPEYLNIAAMDMGYAQCLWRYGIIGTVLLLAGYLNSFRVGMLSTKLKEEKGLIICMFLFFFTYLYKIYSIGNMAGNLIIFGYIILIIDSNAERKLFNANNGKYRWKS